MDLEQDRRHGKGEHSAAGELQRPVAGERCSRRCRRPRSSRVHHGNRIRGCRGCQRHHPVDELEPLGPMGDQQHGLVAAAERTSAISSLAVSGSRCAVGSSSTSTGAAASSARASTIRWRWPPRARGPAPRRGCRARLEDPDPVPDPSAAQRLLDLGVARVRAGEADVVADARGEQVRLLAGDGDRAADVLLAVLASVLSSDRHPAALRVEEAEQQIRTVVLPAPLGPDAARPARPARAGS